MPESQLDLKDKIGENWAAYAKLMPEVIDVYDPLMEEVYKDGDVKAKYKRLMAVVGAWFMVAGPVCSTRPKKP